MTEVNEVNYSSGGGMADGEGGGIGKLIKIIIIAVVVLAVLGGGGATAYFLLSGDGEGEMAGPAPAAAGGGAAAPAARRGGTATIENPQFLALGTFIVNLADGRRYLKTNLSLMLSEVQAKAYLELRMDEVKDLVISELQVLNTEQLRDPQERVNLKQRLLRSIESLLPNKDVDWDDPLPIKKVLITEFYLQ